MGISKLFSKDTNYISRKQMRENYHNDPVFKKIMSDPAMKVLSQPAEQKRFHDLLREKAKDGKVDIHDMRQIADKIAHEGVKDISRAEGLTIARAFFPDSSRRYEHADPEPVKETSHVITNDSHDIKPKDSSSANQVNKIQTASFAYPINKPVAPLDPSKPETKKNSFFSSMRSVILNRKK